MANVVIAQQESEKYTENLFPYSSTLNNSPNIIVTNGGANATPEYFTGIKYNRLRSIRVAYTGTGTMTMNLGSALNFVAPQTGTYIVAFRLLVPSLYEGAEVSGKLTTFTNASESDLNFTNDDIFFAYDKWNAFYQVVNLEQGDTFDAFIKTQTDTIGTRAYFGGFKIELDDRGLGVPSRYTEPYNCIDKTVTLDFPSISGNNYADLTTEMIGAELIDIVDLGHPPLTDHYFFRAFVSDTDEVTVRCINNSGGAIDPASGLFKIKITK